MWTCLKQCKPDVMKDCYVWPLKCKHKEIIHFTEFGLTMAKNATFLIIIESIIILAIIYLISQKFNISSTPQQ
jgi:hypothetical protein